MALSVADWVPVFRHRYATLWWQTSTAFPTVSRSYDRQQQTERAGRVEQFLGESLKGLKPLPVTATARAAWRDRFSRGLRTTLTEAMGFPAEHVALLSTDGYAESTRSFVRQARAFDPEMTMADIFQAARNVWIANSIQLLLQRSVSSSPSVFGYSMIYPYTDNYLDNTDIPKEAKEQMNSRLTRRLCGDQLPPADTYEMHLERLLGMIEGEFPRSRFPRVYQSLLAIHAAQQQSLAQQSGPLSPYEADLLGISVEKGGTSVLADGYLIAGELSESEADFLFGYGVVLQFADDLQDVREDLANGHMTLFAQTAGRWPLDGITNRLIGYVDNVLNTGFHQPSVRGVKELIRSSCFSLILRAVAANPEFYSPEYISRMERYCPLSFADMERLKQKAKAEIQPLRKGSAGANPDTLLDLLLGEA